MSEQLIENIKAQLIALRVVKPEEFIGCTPAEIQEIMQKQGVSFLPDLYRTFLLHMGQSAGIFLNGYGSYYPEILKAKDEARESLVEYKAPMELPMDAFVLFAHDQGYMFYFFHIQERQQNPSVYRYLEGDSEFKKQWDTLTEFYQYHFEYYAEHFRPRK